MTAQILVTLPDKVYQRVQWLAQARQQDVAEAIAEYLEDTLPESEIATLTVEQSAHKAALQREKAAYIKLHPELKKKYLGLYVAVYNGDLIDTDSDYGTLYERVRSQYPDEVVLVTQVDAEPIKTIVVRSPRFIK